MKDGKFLLSLGTPGGGISWCELVEVEIAISL